MKVHSWVPLVWVLPPFGCRVDLIGRDGRVERGVLVTLGSIDYAAWQAWRLAW